MPTTPEEYRATRTKEVKLSSGFEFKIGKLPKEIMSQFLDTVGVSPRPGMDMKTVTEEMEKSMDKPSYKEKLYNAVNLVIPHGTLEPKIVLENPAPPDALSIDELDFGDQMELFMEIVDFQGIPAAAEKFRKRFPRTPSRPASSSA